MQKYDHKAIEEKWRKKWEEMGIYKVDIDNAKNPYYNLMMFPYPSAEGMHVGSMYTFSGIDTYGRYMRMNGYDVFEPFGLDGFGIHSENYAFKIGEHIHEVSRRTEENYYKQIKRVGNMIDWTRTVETYKSNYYKWTQWLFLVMYKAGLAFRKKASLNWCPSCKTVLADEQVINGRCERCDNEVERREQEQWFFKITDYAERLVKNLDWIDWDEGVKQGQINWIGRKEGAIIDYPVDGSEKMLISCFTTRPDTNFGATFIVVAPEYPGIEEIIKPEYKKEVLAYIQTAKNKSTVERMQEEKAKTGVFTGSYAINRLTGFKMPIYIADYVLMDYGTGAVVGVPAHDRRDFDFAVKYGLQIVKVVSPLESRSYVVGYKQGIEKKLEQEGFPFEKNEDLALEVVIPEGKVDSFVEIIKEFLKNDFWNEIVGEKDLFVFGNNKEVIELNPNTDTSIMERCKELNPEVRKYKNAYEMIISNEFYKDFYVFEGDGKVVNSEFLNGLNTKEAQIKIVNYLEKKGYGKKELNYHLRDWCVSRQRYWGAPIPMIKCEKCGWVPVDEKDLPVELPNVPRYEDILPDGSGKPPLEKVEEFVNVKCPKCGADAKRETDVMDTFVDSSWYFLRYPSTDIEDRPFDKKRTRKWLPVNRYIGGKEHTVLHLLYSRFVTMVLHDQGYLDFEEPFIEFRAHGLITKDGAKMSKSRGNVVDPDEWIEKVGADTMRMYFRFMGDFSQGGDWRDTGIWGMYRFVKKIWKINSELVTEKKDDEEVIRKLHKTIKKVGEDIKNLRFNTAVASLMEFVNLINERGHISKKNWLVFIQLIAPMMPYISEEMWEIQGQNGSIHLTKWPEFDKSLVLDTVVTIVVQVNGKVRDKVEVPVGSSKKFVEETAKKQQNASKYLSDGYKKSIYVQDRIINFVL